METQNKIYIETPKEPKDKLIKWYGWITILVLFLTPLVFILLPVLMLNTSKINRLLKESRVPETDAVEGTVKEVNIELKHEDAIFSIQGEIKLEDHQGELITCTYLKYVGKDTRIIPDINEGDKLQITGHLKAEEGEEEPSLLIRNIRNVETQKVYTTEPVLSMY